MALPPKLAKEIEQLGLKPEIIQEGGVINLVFEDYPIPPGYNCSAVNLLIRIPLAYPDAGPDMFWTSPSLLLATGAAPQCGDHIETHIGRMWRRFSWHTSWRPTTDSLHTFINFVHHRLERAC
jgi:E2/UBC family protein E